MAGKRDQEHGGEELNEVPAEVETDGDGEAEAKQEVEQGDADLMKLVETIKLPNVGPKNATKASALTRPSSIIREIFGMFKAEGTSLGVSEIVMVIMLVADLVKTVGPKVKEIFDLVKKALGK